MFDFSQIPDWWALCSGYGCPKAAECLRHVAFQQAPKDIARWTCILPQALEGGECSNYQKTEEVRMARGFAGIMASIRSRDVRHDVRLALTSYFGSKGSYYRFRDGERLMPPQQQEEIIRIMRQNGFQGDIVFDEYIETYDFTQI